MTYITEFAVEGLVGRRGDYAQKLNRDVNIFFGANGSGKTSLLKILHSALYADTSVLSKVPFKSAEVKFYSINNDRIFTRTITQRESPELDEEPLDMETRRKFDQAALNPRQRVVANTRRVASEDFQWETTPKEPKGTMRMTHSYLPTSRLWFGHDLSLRDSIQTEDQLDRAFQNLLSRQWFVYTRDVLSKVGSAQEEGLTNILKWILSPEEKRSKHESETLDVETAFIRVKSFLERQHAQKILGSKAEFGNRYSRSGILKNVVNYIDEVELKIEQAMLPRNNLQDLINRLFGGGKTVRFTDDSIELYLDGDKRRLVLASLSSGEKQILRILVEVLYAQENSLLIDEPEISMHVDWQRELISSMRSVNPETQLILATHSPEIMADTDDDKIFKI